MREYLVSYEKKKEREKGRKKKKEKNAARFGGKYYTPLIRERRE